MALPFFATTLFVSAFLLFLVQPMIGKMILPKLGGTPQVWNTCMVFFQSALLAGYAYTHSVSTRLTLRRQLMVHGILLFVPLIVLFAMGQPFNVSGFEAPPGANPVWYTLWYLTLIVGLPFFVVSTSAPLLQKWFAGTGHPSAQDPYFLYGASNLGSLLALLAYPFVVEPFITLNAQTWVWAVGYLLLIATVLGCAAMVWNAPEPARLSMAGAAVDVPPSEVPAPPPEVVTAIKPAPSAPKFTPRKKGKGQFKPGGRTEPQKAAPTPAAPPRPDVVDLWRRLRWIMLAFVPSSLMLGVITYVSVDLSPFPLLWIVPLALYLLSFVLVFLRWPMPWTDIPHSVMGFIFPLCLLVLAFFSLGVVGTFNPLWHTFFIFLSFFGVALYCHGELARDRPAPRYLTDFYLCMSVGGFLGGVFNGLLAPVMFHSVAELPIALVIACFTRPRNIEGGFLDRWLTDTFPGLGGWVRDRGDELAVGMGKAPPRSIYLLSYTFDILFAVFVLLISLFLKTYLMSREAGWADGIIYNGPIEKNPLFRFWKAMGMSGQSAASWAGSSLQMLTYGPPMLFCFFFSTRRLRFGLALGAILYANLVLMGREGTYLFSGRSYFGVLRVFEHEGYIIDRDIAAKIDKAEVKKYTSMMHGTTLHGENYFFPPQVSRIATTYYHRLGPVGTVMERYNWFYGPQTTNDSFYADNRMPVGMVGMAAASFGTATLPLDQLVHAWSEPPYATVGLGTGTMASYSRPFQHMTYYEIDRTVRNFSLPPSPKYMREDQPFFTYLKGALDRGVNLEVIMGDARQTMQRELPQESNKFEYNGRIYGDTYPKREKYYKVMVIDAFSSDAIPVHLLTYEAVKLYVDKLADDGVLCIHTSNRHLDLVRVVVDIATKQGMKYRYGNDEDRSERRGGGILGHTGSNYVMLARDEKYLQFPQDPASPTYRNTKVTWTRPPPSGGQYLWTDDYSNIVSVIR